MAQALNTFTFEGSAVRTVVIDGEPWFFATDVAKTLGYSNPQKAIRDHCKGVNETVTPIHGTDQTVNIIREGDVFRLIMRSKLPAAQAFEAWVMDEVLPAIRRTGGFQMASPQPASGVELVAQIGQALGILANNAKEHANRLMTLESSQQSLAERIGAIEAKQEEALEMAGSLPEPGVEAAPMSKRAALNAVIRSYHMLSGISCQDVWNDLYRQCYYRMHLDIKARAANRGVRPIEFIEQEGILEEVYAIALAIFGKAKVA